MQSRKTTHLFTSIITYLVLIVLVFSALFPFYWMGLTSLRKGKQVYVKEQVCWQAIALSACAF